MSRLQAIVAGIMGSCCSILCCCGDTIGSEKTKRVHVPHACAHLGHVSIERVLTRACGGKVTWGNQQQKMAHGPFVLNIEDNDVKEQLDTQGT